MLRDAFPHLMSWISKQVWLIDPRGAEKILAMLELRARNGSRTVPYRSGPIAADRRRSRTGSPAAIAVIRLHGPIVPRMSAVEDVSSPAASLETFQKLFAQAAANPDVKAIVIDIDSPGGSVSLVPETAAMIRAAHDPERPIVAVANTLAASAAYWIASAADELVASPSAEVGSIGVYMMHEDVSQALEKFGVHVTFIAEGPRKVEGNPFEPLSGEAKAALQANVRQFYDLFTKDVARHRGVPVARVRADPEKSDRHFGGGRVYPARRAVELGMADRVATLDETVARLQRRR